MKKIILPLFLITLHLILPAAWAEDKSPAESPISPVITPAPTNTTPSAIIPTIAPGDAAALVTAAPSPVSAPPPLPASPGQPTDPAITIAAVGDVYLGAWLEGAIRKEGPDYPWRGTEKILKAADIAVCNLESALSTKSKIFQRKTWTLKAHPDTVKSLPAGGFKVATLANNHMMDFGPEALRETLETLDKEGILHTGAGMNLEAARMPAVVEIKGQKVAFLAYGKIFPDSFYAHQNKAGIAPGSVALVEADVKKAKETAQYVVVSYHWGAELVKTPRDYQRNLAHATIDAGADLVIGHHPHILQGLELYKGRVIAYSLGNFAFGSLTKTPLSGGILTVTLQGGRTIEAKLWPANVNNYQVRYQPQLLEAAAAQRVLAEVQGLSLPFKTTLTIADNLGKIEIEKAVAQDSEQLRVKSKE